MRAIIRAEPGELTQRANDFRDERLKSLLPLYKARNYPRSLSGEERAEWDEFCQQQLLGGGSDSRLTKYFARLEELTQSKLSGQQQYLLEELQLYGLSIIPADVAG